MTIQAITTFLTLETPSGALQGRYQNGLTGTQVTYDGAGYSFLSFIYSGSTKNRTGDNMISSLSLAANQVSMNIASEAVKGFWAIRLDSVLMHPETLQPTRQLSREYWVASGLSYDTQAVQVQLSSAIDAIGADAPNKTLLETYVGALPLTARVSNR
jgi:hypothetical protein